MRYHDPFSNFNLLRSEVHTVWKAGWNGQKKKNAESELIWLKDNEFEYLSEFISWVQTVSVQRIPDYKRGHSG